MKTNKPLSLFALALACSFLLPGCINFYGGDVKPVTLAKAPWLRDQKANLYYDITVVPYSGNGDTGLWSIPKNEALFIVSSGLSKSGYFATAQNTAPAAGGARALQLKFKISMSQSQDMGILLGAGGCLLYLIPVWFTNSIQVDAQLLQDGKFVTSYTYNGECTNFWQTLLFVTAPFSTYSSAIKKIIANGTDQILKNLKDDGYLPYPPKTVK